LFFGVRLVLDDITLLALLVTAQLELLATADGLELTSTALGALEAEHDLLGGLGL